MNITKLVKLAGDYELHFSGSETGWFHFDLTGNGIIQVGSDAVNMDGQHQFTVDEVAEALVNQAVNRAEEQKGHTMKTLIPGVDPKYAPEDGRASFPFGGPECNAVMKRTLCEANRDEPQKWYAAEYESTNKKPESKVGRLAFGGEGFPETPGHPTGRVVVCMGFQEGDSKQESDS